MRSTWLPAFAGLSIGVAVGSAAGTNVWNGTGNWTESGYWSGGVPNAADNVEIASGTSTVSSATTIADLTVDAGATLTFTNWDTSITGRNVTVNGTLTHVPNSDTNGADGWQSDARVATGCIAFLPLPHGTVVLVK